MATEFDDILGDDFQSRRDYVRSIYEDDLGRDDAENDPDGVSYWTGRTDLVGNDLLKAIRLRAGLDNTLLEDPTYAAFDRARRTQALQVQNDLDKSQADLATQRRIAGVKFDSAQREGLQTANDLAESRGMFRSGGRLQARGEVTRDVQQARSENELNYVTGRRDLQDNANRQIQDLSRERDEQELAARTRLTNQSIQDTQRAAI